MLSLTLRAPIISMLFGVVLALFAAQALAETSGNQGGHYSTAPSNDSHSPTNSPASPATSGACGAIELPDPAKFADAGDAVKALSEATKLHLATCQCSAQNCIADALDAYAAKLAVVAPRLPARLRNLPSIVSNAAKKVRTAKSLGEAVRILRVAVVKVQKEVELIRAGGTEATGSQTRGGDFVADTLAFAATKLERASGI